MNKNKKVIIAIVTIFLVVFIAALCYFYFSSDSKKEDETSLTTITSSSAVFVTESTTLAPSTTATTTTNKHNETEKHTELEKTTVTTTQAKGYTLPLSINQALNALNDHYGSGFKINSTVEEDGYNYFAVYKDDYKYASVAVNLVTGESKETIISTGKTTDFYLV